VNQSHKPKIIFKIKRSKNLAELSADGLVKSRELNFSPQDGGHKIEKATISCGQNKMLGLFTSTSSTE
jgi:hypothetical protein